MAPHDFSSKAAANDINSYFDSLSTGGCNTADCLHPKAVVRKAPRAMISRKQLVHMEKTYLGYDRRREEMQEDKELSSLAKESSSLVEGTANGEAAVAALVVGCVAPQGRGDVPSYVSFHPQLVLSPLVSPDLSYLLTSSTKPFPR